MSSTAKTLILIWVAVGFVIVGVAGFYLGKITTQNNQMQLPQQQPPSQQLPQQQFPGGQQPQSGSQQQIQPMISPTLPQGQGNQQPGGFNQGFGQPNNPSQPK